MQVPGEARRAPGEARFAVAVALVYLAVATVAAAFHEPWRDETHAWLIARDATGPLSLLRNLRYDGHPALWHAVLWPFTRLGGPGLLQVVSVGIGTASAFVFARLAPFPRLVRALFAFGCLQLWEWGVIARSYGLGVLLLLLAAELVARRRRHALAAGLVLALAANTSVHAAIVAASLVAVLVVERCAPWQEATHRAPASRFWGGVGLALAGVVACALQIRPPPDSAVASWWAQNSTLELLGVLVAAPVHGLAFASWPAGLGRAAVPLIAAAAVLAAALVFCSWQVLARRRAAWIAAALSWSALGALFFFRYYGGPRHAGFLLVALLVALWIAPTFPARPGGRAADGAAQRRLGTALGGALACAVVGSVVLGAPDARGVYSAARDTADLIRARGLAGLPLVGDPDFSTSGVLAFLGARTAFYENVARRGSFAVWDARHDRHRPEAKGASDEAVFARARALAGRAGALVVIDREANAGVVSAAGARFVGARRADVHVEESFWVYVVPGASPP